MATRRPAAKPTRARRAAAPARPRPAAVAPKRRAAGAPDDGQAPPLPAPVAALLAVRAHPLEPVLLAVRRELFAAAPGLEEGVKWNAPSYRFQGADRLTFQLRADDCVRLVFHCGSQPSARPGTPRRCADPADLLDWAAPDRGIAAFASPAEVAAVAPALRALVQAWLAADR